MKILLSLFVLLFSTSVFAKKTDNLPPINTENEVFMGDRMVEQNIVLDIGVFLEVSKN